MASPPVLSPSGTTGFNRQSWMDGFEEPTYQKTVFIDSIQVYPGRLMNVGNVRKEARVSATVLAQDADGDGLTPVNPSGTPVTITPVGRFVQVEWSANEKAQVEVDLNAALARNIEKALAEAMDSAGLSNATSLTQNISQASIDSTMWRRAVGLGMQNTNGQYMPGDWKAVFSPTQYPNIMAIDEFTHADVRGDSENPTVKGIFTKGGGVNVRFSTVVTQDANGWHNPLYVESAFIIGWNTRPQAFSEQTELLFRINTFANMGVSILHDLRAIDLRLTASAL